MICILPYRRFKIGRVSESSGAPALAEAQQNAILRYSRLQICATLNTHGRPVNRQAGSLPYIFKQPLNRFRQRARSMHSEGARLSRSVLKATRLFGCVIAACVLAGCQSTSPSQYSSPRVEGRVLNAQTHQPIDGVTVRRIDPSANVATDQAPKGGQVMQQAPAVRTTRDGAFVLASERNLQLFRRSGWYSVTLSFEHYEFLSFTTNYTLANATNTPSGEPLVKAGDILLAPLSR
jgi:hypothetical protein